MLRCIEQVRPSWFVGENVAGITKMAFPGEDVKVGEQTDLFGACDEVYEKHERYVLDEICQSLERAGYSVQPMLIPACAVGAPHRRDRVFIVAHRLTEDTLHSGLMGREHDEQGCERNIGNAGARGAERVCGEPMAGTIADTDRSNDGTRRPEEPTSTMREERMSERDAIQQSIITAGLRSRVEGHSSYTTSQPRREIYEQVQYKLADGAEPFGNGTKRNVTDTCGEGLEGMHESGSSEGGQRMQVRRNSSGHDCESVERMLPENRWRTFPSVSPVYRGNDGLPFPVDHLTIPFSEWKRESLKAYGNAIVPQVMYEIFRCIDEIEQTLNPE